MRALAYACLSALLLLGAPAQAAPKKADLRIDVDVVLKNAKVVFNMDHLAFAGKEPFGLLYMRLMQGDFAKAGTPAQIVAIFHGAAGYMLLSDAAYNKARKTKGGNPYAKEIARLQATGIQFEECGQTARDNGWVNADLLPGVKVNSGANFRIVQLVQDGFVQIQP